MSGSARARQPPKPRPAPRAAPKSAPRQPARAAPPALSGWRRWRWVAVLVLAAVLGLPLAHAMFGEVVALLGGTFLLGLLVGRWTAR
ncbi:hypothetical protein [Roseicella aquatilis]|uniref:Uncharacterized protein n=1 Tax=Roseicella aquatilis TaxID=2527868 RepID=A0A4V2WLT0_9PROT|nr:hypothetical protein [Roseicella aquatilis]TCZ64417.1 hypothetical protein EXY23_07150 [Roseicella aquatilis]